MSDDKHEVLAYNQCVETRSDEREAFQEYFRIFTETHLKKHNEVIREFWEWVFKDVPVDEKSRYRLYVKHGLTPIGQPVTLGYTPHTYWMEKIE